MPVAFGGVNLGVMLTAGELTISFDTVHVEVTEDFGSGLPAVDK